MSRDIHTQHTRHLFNVCHKDNTKKSKRLSNRQHQSNTSVPVLSSLSPPSLLLGDFPFSSPSSHNPFFFPPHPLLFPLSICFLLYITITLLYLPIQFSTTLKRKERKEKKRRRYTGNKRTREEKREEVEERAGGREGNLPQSRLILRLKMNQPTITLNNLAPTQSYI